MTITRDDWGIAHVEGKTDADAVFGMIYAQAEDDFNRIETNYLVSLGRLAEAEGESAIWQDLRQRLFIDPDDAEGDVRARARPGCKQLMSAWADGLNYYLATHPEVRPRVITRFEPWMALSFTEGSIGGDIERVSLTQLEAFYGAQDGCAMTDDERGLLFREPHGLERLRHRARAHEGRPCAAADQSAHLFFFRSELQMTSDEGLERLRRGHLGPVLHLPGLQRARRLDAHLERRRQRRRVRRDDRRPMPAAAAPTAMATSCGRSRREDRDVPYTRRRRHRWRERSFTVYPTHHGPIVREADGKWIAIALMNKPVEALEQSFLRTKTSDYAGFLEGGRAQGQLLEQHAVRRLQGRDRLPASAVHADPRRPLRLHASRSTAAIRRPTGRACTTLDEPAARA